MHNMMYVYCIYNILYIICILVYVSFLSYIAFVSFELCFRSDLLKGVNPVKELHCIAHA